MELTMKYTNAQKFVGVLLIVLIAWFMTSPIIVQGFAGVGGFISEKLLGNGADEALYLGDGTNENGLLGSAPIVFTGDFDATSTLYGNLVDLNGMPQATLWFEWGYTPAANSASTATTTLNAPGEWSVTIFPKAGQIVYYQLHGSTDGESVGSVQSFLAGGAGPSYLLMRIIPIVVACALLVFAIRMGANPMYAFVGTFIGLIAFYIVWIIMENLF